MGYGNAVVRAGSRVHKSERRPPPPLWNQNSANKGLVNSIDHGGWTCLHHAVSRSAGYLLRVACCSAQYKLARLCYRPTRTDDRMCLLWPYGVLKACPYAYAAVPTDGCGTAVVKRRQQAQGDGAGAGQRRVASGAP
eukprot:976445-Rhodomonas_salina.2